MRFCLISSFLNLRIPLTNCYIIAINATYLFVSCVGIRTGLSFSTITYTSFMFYIILGNLIHLSRISKYFYILSINILKSGWFLTLDLKLANNAAIYPLSYLVNPTYYLVCT